MNRNLLKTLLAISVGIFLSCLIINCQNNQQKGYGEPISDFEKEKLYQQYLQYIEEKEI